MASKKLQRDFICHLPVCTSFCVCFKAVTKTHNANALSASGTVQIFVVFFLFRRKSPVSLLDKKDTHDFFSVLRQASNFNVVRGEPDFGGRVFG